MPIADTTYAAHRGDSTDQSSDTPELDVLARTLHDAQVAWARTEPGIDPRTLCRWDELDVSEQDCYRRMAAAAVRAVWQLGGPPDQ